MKKRGALDFGANALGRIILLFLNIFQISSRLVAFVLFAYSWGDGNFWPAFVFVLLHILVLAAFHFEWNDKDTWVQFESSCLFFSYPKGMAVFQSILNGISNLYMNNLIRPLPSKEKKKQQNRGSTRSFSRQCRWTLCGGELRCHPPCCFRSQHQRCLASLGFCLPRSAQWAPSQGDLLQILPHLELNLDKKG